MKKRAFAFLLAMLMLTAVLTALLLPVSAAPEKDSIDSWAALQAAITEAGETPTTIRLTCDLTATASDSALLIEAGQNITLDLNGYVLNRNLIAFDGTPTGTDRGSVIEVMNHTIAEEKEEEEEEEEEEKEEEKEEEEKEDKDDENKAAAENNALPREEGFREVFGEVDSKAGVLTVIDSRPDVSHPGFVDANGLWHWDESSSHSLAPDETAKTLTGGIITGGTGRILEEEDGSFKTYGGGICCEPDTVLTLSLGTIAGNKVSGEGRLGGGVYHVGNFAMKGGMIFGNAAKNGGGVYGGEAFCLYDGVISGNIAESNGGGVFDNNSVSIFGGIISGNAAENGGGVFVEDEKIFAMAGGVVANNVAGEGAGVYCNAIGSTGGGCLGKGTLITMADGSTKPVEQVERGEDVLVFDHETGTAGSAPAGIVLKQPELVTESFTMHFSDGTALTVVGGRGFYSRKENRYVALNYGNADQYLGWEFYRLGKESGGWITLTEVERHTEPVEAYVLVTEGVLNCVSEGVLSCEDIVITPACNVFDFDENMTVDPVKKQADIDRWGLLTHDEFPEIPEEFFDTYPIRYAKIAVGKGLTTTEEIKSEVIKYYRYMEELLHSAEPSPLTSVQSGEKKQKTASPALSDASSSIGPEASGITLGGTARISGNKKPDGSANNVYLKYDDQTNPGQAIINVGTGLQSENEEYNDVIAPLPGMWVGVHADSEELTTNGGMQDPQFFFADEEGYYVDYDYSDECLKLVHLEENERTVRIIPSLNGVVYTDRQVGKAGDTVRLTVVPAEDGLFKAGTLKVTYTDGETKECTLNMVGVDLYTFTMPDKNVTVTAEFMEAKCLYLKKLPAPQYGVATLSLGNRKLDRFLFEPADGGWTMLGKNGQYLSAGNGYLEYRVSPFVWNWDGRAFYVNELTYIGGFRLGPIVFPGIPVVKKLYPTALGAPLSSDFCASSVWETVANEGDHAFGDWTPDGTGMHTRTCIYCGETETGECEYDGSACKICGGHKPGSAFVTVEVREETRKKPNPLSILFPFLPTESETVYTIFAQPHDTSVLTVEYSLDGGRSWTRGTTFTAKKPAAFEIRVRNTSGGTQRFTYANGKVTENKGK